MLAHSIVSAPGSSPCAAMYFLHGILGSGGNWRTLARRFVAARPEWAAVLVDLRMHGQSQGARPPHSVASCAQDLVDLEAALPLPVRAVLGHSFGGKVALQFAQQRSAQLTDAWIIDAMPGSRLDARGSETTVQALDLLSGMATTWPSREAFVAQVRAHGFSESIAQWLAMNVRREGDAFVWRLDLQAMRSMIDDYFARDLWHVVERPTAAVRVHVLIGGRSPAFQAADRARVETAAIANPERISFDVFPNAGHWVHVDEPDALLERLVAATAAVT